MKVLVDRIWGLRSWRRNAARAEVLRGLIGVLAEDPVVKVSNLPGRFRIGAHSDLFKRIALHGEYERRLVEVCRSHCDAARDAIDVGANVGLYTVLMAAGIGCPRVLAIEPTPAAERRLRWNIQANDCSHKALIYHGAVGAGDGNIEINVVDGREEYSTLGALAHPSAINAPSRRLAVPITTVDQLVARYALRPGFVKIDVEGMEHMVLRGMEQVCAQYRPVVLAELIDPLLRRNGSSGAEVVGMMRSAGYVVTDPETGGEPGRRPFGDILCVPAEL